MRPNVCVECCGFDKKTFVDVVGGFCVLGFGYLPASLFFARGYMCAVLVDCSWVWRCAGLGLSWSWYLGVWNSGVSRIWFCVG